MTREQKIEAFAMKLDGATYQKIADRFGVSRQYIQQCLTDEITARKKRQLKLMEKCIYPNVALAMIERGISKKKLAEILWPGASLGVCAYRIESRLTGKTAFFAEEWFHMAELFSLPLEVLMQKGIRE